MILLVAAAINLVACGDRGGGCDVGNDVDDDDSKICGGKGAPEEGAKVRSNRGAWDRLRAALEGVREACGEVCDTTKTGTPGRYYEFIRKEVDCR